MTDSCFRVSRLLERRNAGLSEADGLVLERHLSECVDCRRDSALLRGLSELSERAAAGAHLSQAPERLLARALQRVESQTPARGSLVWSWRERPRLVLAFGLAAALSCALAVQHFRQREPVVALAPAAAAPGSAGLVLKGNVLLGAKPLATGAAVPDGAELTVSAASELSLAHATVRTPEPTRLAWVGSDSCLELRSGALDVSVDPRPHRPFAVKTALFRVDVLGTEFHVDARSVSVTRGRVRVSTAAGVQVALLDPGQRWQFEEPSDTARAASDEPSKGEEPNALSPVGPRLVTASQSLTLARHALASGDVASARRAIELALGAQPRAGEQAEAHMLLGDAARIAGNVELSSSEYLGVFEHYRSLPLAESALFSAARVEARAGHSARADQLFARYLAAYPHGQFQAQAREHVHASGKP